MSSIRLSHSAASRFQTCARSYELHYIKKLRPKLQSAALLFGSAVDAAIGAMLKPDGKSPEQVFAYSWQFAEINGEKEHLPDCTKIVYSDSDADFDLLDKQDIEKLESKYGPDLKGQIISIVKQKEDVGFKGLTEDQKILFNLYNWHCLSKKGKLMIDAFRIKVMPRISEVLSVQEYVKLENDNGDSVIGYVDLVARLHDYGKPVIIDLKTSSIDYKADSVATSPQLALYKHALGEKYGTNLAGFIVLKKRINKNKEKVCEDCGFSGTGTRFKTCNNEVAAPDKNGDYFESVTVRCDGKWIETIKPEVEVQTIISEIPERYEEIVLENFDDINKAIKNGSFIRNLSSCVRPWGLCEFYNVCHSNDTSDLVDTTPIKSEPKPFR